MSAKAAWRKQLIEELGSLLAPYGFVFVAASRAYRRRTAIGWEAVHLALIDHQGDFDVIVNVAIRFDEIQKHIDGGGDRRGRAATIGCEYGNLMGTGRQRWSITSVDDVSAAASGIMRACRDTLFPFFEKYSDLAMVYETLRHDSPEGRLLMPLEAKRRDIVEAAALLLRRPE